MRSTPDATARDVRNAAETLPEIPAPPDALDAAIAALDLSPPPALTLAERAPVPARLPISPLAMMTPAVVPVIASSAPPSRNPESFGPSSFGRDIVREERDAKRKTTILVASLWTVALALVGALLFMING